MNKQQTLFENENPQLLIHDVMCSLHPKGYDISFINLNYTRYGMKNHSDKLHITVGCMCSVRFETFY